MAFLWLDVAGLGVIYDDAAALEHVQSTRAAFAGLRQPGRINSGTGDRNARQTVRADNTADLRAAIEIPPLGAVATLYRDTEALYTGVLTEVSAGGEDIALTIER